MSACLFMYFHFRLLLCEVLGLAATEESCAITKAPGRKRRIAYTFHMHEPSAMNQSLLMSTKCECECGVSVNWAAARAR